MDDKKYSGRLIMRLPMGLHESVADEADRQGVSINTYVASVLAGAVGWRPAPPPAPAPKRNVRTVAARADAPPQQGPIPRDLPASIGEYATVQEVAELLKLNPQTVRNWIDLGSLRASRVGRRVRIARTDLEEFVKAGATDRPADSP